MRHSLNMAIIAQKPDGTDKRYVVTRTAVFPNEAIGLNAATRRVVARYAESIGAEPFLAKVQLSADLEGMSKIEFYPIEE